MMEVVHWMEVEEKNDCEPSIEEFDRKFQSNDMYHI